MNRNLEHYAVEKSVGQGQNDINTETEMKRVYYSAIDAILGEIEARFSERDGKLITALTALDPEDDSFLDATKVKPILDLVGVEIVQTQYTVAREFLLSEMAPEDNWTVQKVLSKHYKTLESMPTVLLALRLALVFGASTATCENSFSTLKSVFTDRRHTMLHTRKARLVQLAFEKDLTQKCRTEWKDAVLRKFHAGHNRRLQLF